jgi:transposase
MGVWERVLAARQAQGDWQGQLNWELHHVDSTIVRAHQHAAGAWRAKGGPSSKRSGRAKEA